MKKPPKKTLQFFKYHGTGNDFVLIDNRADVFFKDENFIRKLCDRRFGIGGDGLILLEKSAETDFKMIYYNADGREGSMCGNGGRCIVAFAHYLDLFEEKTVFEATDGLHVAAISNGKVKLKMIDVPELHAINQNYTLNTGSPHFVTFKTDVKNTEVYRLGNEIRNSATYSGDGINVNFAEETAPGKIFVRTYERGVEDETYSCGTGATAAALVYLLTHRLPSVEVQVLGGELTVYADKRNGGFKNIWLEGPATMVFEGKIKQTEI